MRGLFDLNVRDNQNITSLFEQALNPAINLGNMILAKRYQSLYNNDIVTISYDEDISADCFFYGLHNLNSLEVVYKNSVGATIQTITVATLNDIGVEYFTQINGIRSIELDITTTDSNAYIGGFETGIFTQINDFLNAYPIDLTDNSLFRKSPGGHTTFERVRPLWKCSFSYAEGIRSYVIDILNKYSIVSHSPIYFDITEGNRDYFEPRYANIINIPTANKQNRRYSNSLILEESR